MAKLLLESPSGAARRAHWTPALTLPCHTCGNGSSQALKDSPSALSREPGVPNHRFLPTEATSLSVGCDSKKGSFSICSGPSKWQGYFSLKTFLEGHC